MGRTVGSQSNGEIWDTDIKIAEELLYPKEVIEALKLEPDRRKRMSILTNARKQEIRKDLDRHGKINRNNSTNKRNKRCTR